MLYGNIIVIFFKNHDKYEGAITRRYVTMKCFLHMEAGDLF